MRTSPRLFATLLALGFALLVALPLGLVSRASPSGKSTSSATAKVSATASVPGAASISGTVTEPGGAGLPDIEVTLYERNPKSQLWRRVDSLSTDGSGDYQLAVPDAGAYHLGFTDASGEYLDEYFDDAGQMVSFGADVPVEVGEAVTGKDAELAVAGHLTGMVIATGGAPLVDIKVTVYGWGNDESFVPFRHTVTDSDGRYDLGGLPTGRYRLGFGDDSGGGYVPEFYDDISDLYPAADIAVTAGETTTVKDARLVMGGRITGTVTKTGGAPLRHVRVTAYEWNAVNGTWGELHHAFTNHTGFYDLRGLGTRTYRIGFDASEAGYVEEFFGDVATVDNATDVVVREGVTIDERDAQLAAGGHITGTVTGPGGARVVTRVQVLAYEWNRRGYWEAVKSVETDTAGSYDLGGLSTGVYRIGFQDSTHVYTAEYFEDASTIQAGTDIAVTTESTTSGNDAEIGLATHITGTVTGARGVPLKSVGVFAYEWSEIGRTWTFVIGAQTNTDRTGAYDLPDLPAGTYRLEFTDLSGEGYASEFYDDAATVRSATDVHLGAGETVAHKDAQLSPGSRR